MKVPLPLALGIVLAMAGSAPAQASKATVLTQNDMKLLQVYLDTASGVLGKLPDKAMTLDALKMENGAAKLVKAIDAGSLILNSGGQRDGIWAYEKKAPVSGGFILGSNGIEQLDAAAAKKRLEK